MSSIVTHRVETVRVPWYLRPTGKLDPKTLVLPSILDWKVFVKRQVPEFKKSGTPIVGVPGWITVVIDESGSTTDLVGVLAPLISTSTTAYDVERVTAMALLRNVMKIDSKVPTTLVRFSSRVEIEEGTVENIYDWLKNANTKDLMLMGTEIVAAVGEALKRHKDKTANYFLVLTDMQISDQDAVIMSKMIEETLRQSPTLILAVNAEIPEPLKNLNKHRNIAAVSVTTVSDYSKLEEAIRKLLISTRR